MTRTLALALCLSSLTAVAAERHRLQWVRLQGAETCIDAAQIQRRVEQRLRTRIFDPGAARSIEGIVRREDGAWRAELVVRSGSDSDAAKPAAVRHLQSSAADCTSLGDAVVLAVTLAVDPDAAYESPDTHEREATQQSSPSNSLTVDSNSRLNDTDSRPTRTGAGNSQQPRGASVNPRLTPPLATAGGSNTRNYSELRMGALALTQYGVLPRLSPGVALVSGYEFVTSWQLQLSMRAYPAITTHADPDFSLGATSAAAHLALELVARSALQLRVSGGAAGTLLHAALREGARVDPGERASLAAEIGLQLSLPVAAFALEAGLTGSVPLPRYRLYLEGTDRTLFEQPLAAVHIHVGVAVGSQRR